jgi:APA family basic amino acid/polyamine antiporter
VERPYRVWGYPVLPAAYIAGGSVVLLILFAYRPATTWPGLVIVIAGGLVYAVLQYIRRTRHPGQSSVARGGAF